MKIFNIFMYQTFYSDSTNVPIFLLWQYIHTLNSIQFLDFFCKIVEKIKMVFSSCKWRKKKLFCAVNPLGNQFFYGTLSPNEHFNTHVNWSWGVYSLTPVAVFTKIPYFLALRSS